MRRSLGSRMAERRHRFFTTNTYCQNPSMRHLPSPRKDLVSMTNCLPTLRLVAIFAAMSLLAGCFQSEQPKFPLAEAAAPFGDGGRYVVYEWVTGDRFERQEVFVITRRPDRAYDFVNEKGEVLTISLHAVGGDRFAGQATDPKEPDKAEHSYVVFRVTGNDVMVYLPQCDKQNQAMLAAAGVELKGRFDCFIDRVADPAALFKQLELGDPISKLVRE